MNLGLLATFFRRYRLSLQSYEKSSAKQKKSFFFCRDGVTKKRHFGQNTINVVCK